MTDPLFPMVPASERIHSHLRPSIFELLAQEQLRDLLHPVVRYVLSYFAQRYPRYLLRILNYHEEFFACLLLILERHHLKKHNASLSEHFYNLRLSPIPSISTPRLDALFPSSPRNISRKQRYSLLLFLVGIPYIRARFQSHYNDLTPSSDPSDPSSASSPPHSRLNTLFRTLYPPLNTTYELYLLSHSLSYLFNKTSHHRPWHKLLHLQVQRSTPQPSLSPSPRKSILDRLPPLLPILLLGLKLSQWWYSPNSPRTLPSQKDVSNKHARILPPRPLGILQSSGLIDAPPEYEEVEGEAGAREKGAIAGKGEEMGKRGYEVDLKGYGVCPLCEKKWVNPSVLSSGWVVCWRCGWEAVEGDEEEDEDEVQAEAEHDGHGWDVGRDAEGGEREKEAGQSIDQAKGRRGRCPITGVAIGPGELRRVLV